MILIGALVFQNMTLGNYFQTLKPVPGGIYNEGIVGSFTNANPLYATNSVDTSVSRLVFASLFKYNNQNDLVGDLATGYSVDAKGLVYTVHLRPHLTWQDGQPLTSADVLFTYKTIQNPDALSALQSSWQGIIVTAVDPLTITFKLPDPLASFPYNMTNGIVPQHILAQLPVADLRSADFNTLHPIGSGPFVWQSIQVTGSDPAIVQSQITLTQFKNYHAGRPKIQQFIVHAYASQNQLIKAFAAGQLSGAEGLNYVPSVIQSMSGAQVHSNILTAANMVFFKTSSGILSDKKLRSALVQASNVPKIIDSLGYPTRAVQEPLLVGQLAYDPSLKQLGYDQKSAQTTLEANGWLMGKNGIRTKNGQNLTIRLSTPDTPEYHLVASQLQKDWSRVGAQLQTQYLDKSDFQTTLSQHDYQALLYGISIGVDPDVFVYWDSSQADIRSVNRLNLSEYKNATADAALEAGRTRLDPMLRTLKYKPFLQVWQQDNPALGLYQPRSLYVTNGSVAGLGDGNINTPTDRLNNVENWEIRLAKVTD